MKKASQQTRPRGTCPVFVVGCPRSGTSLLHHMILSGGFAGYPFETDTYRLLGPKFPDLASMKNRKKLVEFWLRSENFAKSCLDRSDVEPRVLRDCRNIGDFLRIVMEETCRKQGFPRWAEKTPYHALYIPQIRRQIPGALIVHIIRDGRDAALSLANFGRIRPFFWERGSKLVSFGVYWKWIVRKARAAGQRIGGDYYELHYEDLVENPRDVLARLGGFIGHDLDYDHIMKVGIGSVSRPESSFQRPASSGGFNPVGRWRKKYTAEDLAGFEAAVGDALEETGYSLATPPEQRRRTFSAGAISAFYVSQLESAFWLKSYTPLGRLAGRRHFPPTGQGLS